MTEKDALAGATQGAERDAPRFSPGGGRRRSATRHALQRWEFVRVAFADGNPHDALRAAEEGLQVAIACGNVRLQASFAHMISSTHYLMGHLSCAAVSVESALTLAHRSGAAEEQAQSLVLASLVLGTMGLQARSEALRLQATELIDSLTDLESRAQITNTIAMCLCQARQHDLAREFSTQSLAACTGTVHRPWHLNVLETAASIAMECGLWDDAEKFVCTAEGLLQRHPSGRYEADFLLCRATLALAQGNLEDALRYTHDLAERYAGLHLLERAVGVAALRVHAALQLGLTSDAQLAFALMRDYQHQAQCASRHQEGRMHEQIQSYYRAHVQMPEVRTKLLNTELRLLANHLSDNDASRLPSRAGRDTVYCSSEVVLSATTRALFRRTRSAALLRLDLVVSEAETRALPPALLDDVWREVRQQLSGVEFCLAPASSCMYVYFSRITRAWALNRARELRNATDRICRTYGRGESPGVILVVSWISRHAPDSALTILGRMDSQARVSRASHGTLREPPALLLFQN